MYVMPGPDWAIGRAAVALAAADLQAFWQLLSQFSWEYVAQPSCATWPPARLAPPQSSKVQHESTAIAQRPLMHASAVFA